MRVSQYFLPTLKETPAEATLISHQYMLRAGMIRQTSAGIYTWLPLGLRVLRAIERIVREEMDKAGAIEVLMPSIQSADIWKESGRYDDYGDEMLRIKDRHDHDLLFGPTHEEQITQIFKETVQSYKALPLNLYQIQWKFRDEIRPRFGVMRGREFLMKDSYSFDLNEEDGQKTYKRMMVAYLKIFHRLGLQAMPMKADSGAIGGNNSHEFLIKAPHGESEIFYDEGLENLPPPPENLDYNDDTTIENITKQYESYYATTDEKHDPHKVMQMGIQNLLKTSKAIEVGHIFLFGDKYSASMQAKILATNGQTITPYMGSYGIGISRLVGAFIEANHDSNGIIWSPAIAPFHVGIISISKETQPMAKELYKSLKSQGIETLWDDRYERAGAKFATMDLIGLPYHIIIGAKSQENKTVELKRRKDNKREEIPMNQVISRLKEIQEKA